MNNSVMSVKRLRAYLSSDVYCNNWHPNILVYGDDGYGKGVTDRLLKTSQRFVVEVTQDALKTRPDEVLSTLTSLYEKGVLKYMFKGGVAVILHEGVIEDIFEEPNRHTATAYVLERLYREGGHLRSVVIAITQNKIPDRILYDNLFFICQRKNKRRLDKYLSKINRFEAFKDSYALIVENRFNILFAQSIRELTKKIANKCLSTCHR